MAKVPETVDDLVGLARKSAVIDEKRLDEALAQYRQTREKPKDLSYFARMLIRDGVLTYFQAEQLLRGKHRGFVLGKYRLLERLGAGGMSQVFLAEHKLMLRKVAIKILPTAGQSSESIQRFYREARAVASMDHPNIVQAHDIDSAGEVHFMVMEYVEGLSLQQLLEQTKKLPMERAINYIAQAGIGLHHIHSSELIHRDIKPGNLLVDTQGVVKILDLGLARFNEDTERLTAQMDLNAFLGTAEYLSPEQGMDSSQANFRSDIYCLGGTFYFLMTGRPPFEGITSTDKLMAHQIQKPKPLTELVPGTPKIVSDLALQMLEKDPAKRPQSAAEVVQVLRPWLEKEIPPPTERPKIHLSPLVKSLLGQIKLEPLTPEVRPTTMSDFQLPPVTGNPNPYAPAANGPSHEKSNGVRPKEAPSRQSTAVAEAPLPKPIPAPVRAKPPEAAPKYAPIPAPKPAPVMLTAEIESVTSVVLDNSSSKHLLPPVKARPQNAPMTAKRKKKKDWVWMLVGICVSAGVGLGLILLIG